MKTKIFTIVFLAAGLLAFGVRAAAQHSHDHAQEPAQQGQATQAQPNPGMMGGDMMGQMKAHHQQMSELMNKVMQSMAAIQGEKDPEALKSKLAEHKALLDQMHSKMMEQGKNMHMMPGQKKQGCMDATETAKPPAN